jgi:hypothetical protein
MTENATEPLNEQEDAALAAKITRLQQERDLVLKLADAGATDIEAATLVGMSRLAKADAPNMDAVVASMQKEKAHLFAADANVPPAPTRTSGTRRKAYDRTATLEGAAKRAAKSGNRTDLQHYLRLRRKQQ